MYLTLICYKLYTAYFEPKDYDDCLTLGHRRYMVTVNIEGPINSPNLYDNPFISAITSKILGEDFILGGLNIGVSLPGSKNQVVHKDYPPLFVGISFFSFKMP